MDLQTECSCWHFIESLEIFTKNDTITDAFIDG